MIYNYKHRLPKMEAKEATKTIRQIVRSENLELYLTRHAKERLEERGLIIRDILYVLKYGEVDGVPQDASRGYFKYRMASQSPNSQRKIAVVVIPDTDALKIITVMWVGEKSER